MTAGEFDEITVHVTQLAVNGRKGARRWLAVATGQDDAWPHVRAG